MGDAVNIIVDVNHPAHVHFFKNFVLEMERRGHNILITATEKDVTFGLLDSFNFNYVDLGSYGNTLLKKLVNLPLINIKMYFKIRHFRPDIFVGLGSIRAAHVSFFLRKKCIIFEDTEHSTEQIKLYLPFTDFVYTPSCFKNDLGKKQVKYKGYHELAYLHPNYFTPNPEVLSEIGLTENDTFVVLRFVSWGASHDLGHRTLSLDDKINAVNELKKYGHVIITSEHELPSELEEYRTNISPDKMHDLLYYTTLLYGDSATMASECAVLGTHSIYCDYAGRGYTDEEEQKYDLVYNFYDENTMGKESLKKAIQLLQDPKLKESGRAKRDILLADKVDVTKFMVDLLENESCNLINVAKRG